MFEIKEIKIGDKKVEVLYSKITVNAKTVVFGFSRGREINFHPAFDKNLVNTNAVLEALNISTENILTPQTEHGDEISVNKISNDCDGIISTNNHTLLMSPADCIICGAIDLDSGDYGIFHSGRRGIGLNIAEKFVKKFIEVEENINKIKFFIAPHISGDEYPHENDNFKFENGQENWWSKHPEHYIKPDSDLFYPNAGPAVRQQLEEVSKDNKIDFNIKFMDESTFSGNYHSHSRDSKIDKDIKKRNLVFIGVSN